MRFAKIKEMLDSDDTATLVDLNDWAVNTLRGYCRENNYSDVRLFAQERARIIGEDMTLDDYRKCRRIGSHYRLSRVMRGAVYAVYATKRKLH